MPFIGVLIGWIVRFFGPFMVAVSAGFLVSLTDWGHDMLIWLFDQLLDLAVTALIDVCTCGVVSGNANFGFLQSAWAALPIQILGMARLLGLSIILPIIVCALTIRFFLQMIPGVRWGSK